MGEPISMTWNYGSELERIAKSLEGILSELNKIRTEGIIVQVKK